MATSMSDGRTMEEFLELCDTFDYVRWSTCDVNGNSKSKITPGKSVRKFIDKGGKPFCAAVYVIAANADFPDNDWVIANGYPDVVMYPEPDTFHKVTWSKSGRKVGNVLVKTLWPQSRELFEGDPRNAVLTLLDKLQNKGYDIMSAMEYEFRLFHRQNTEWIPLDDNQNPYDGYLVHKNEKILMDITDGLQDIGLNLEAFHSEFGSGQYEITMSPKWGVLASDEGFLYRQTVKQIADNHDLIASFMPTPIYEQAGNGLHFNHSLWSKDHSTNLFYSDKDDGMSDIMKHWLAGLIHHARAISAITSPTTNCYNRLHLPFSPDFCDWGLESRNATFRTKHVKGKPSATYIENRAPSSAANPYIVTAATIAAGLDGIERQLPLPKDSERNQGKLPSSLSEAIQALKEDTILRQLIGERVVDFYIDLRTQVDLKYCTEMEHMSPKEKIHFEREKYLEFI